MPEYFNLAGKSALVIGGTRGIGLAVARRFAAAGCRTTVAGRTDRQDRAGRELSFVHCDVRDESSVESAFKQVSETHPELHIVVINAGIAIDDARPLASMALEGFDASMQVNARGSMLCLRAACRAIADGGSIIVTTTGAARFLFPGYAAYGATKAPLDILVRHAAAQLGRRGVRVNCISPGTIVTDAQPADDAEARVCRSHTCLGRLGSVDDVVGAFHFLASDESRYVTASEIVVDGGWVGGVTESTLQAILRGDADAG